MTRKVDLDFDQKVNQDNNWYPGSALRDLMALPTAAESERNLPAIFAIGVSYKLNPKIRLETNFTYYLNKDAGFDDCDTSDEDRCGQWL